MTNVVHWGERLARATAHRDDIEAEPAAVASSVEELLELARDEEWLVQRTAVDALGAGLRDRPEAGLPELDALVRTALDESVPSPDRWRAGVEAVVRTAPELGRDAALDGFDAVPPDRRGENGSACVARALEGLAIDAPATIAPSLDRLRAVSRTLSPSARTHVFGAHLALADDHREAVRSVVPDLLSAFETGDADTRRVAADLLASLAAHPDDGPAVVEAIVHWLATHPREPSDRRPWLDPRESVMRPSLTDSPPSGTLGLAQVLARLAEETPDAVAPHCGEIAASLAAWESTRDDQWPRCHLARAVAAVARQRPRAVAAATDEVRTLLADDSQYVRYWAAQAVLALYPSRPDAVSATVVADLLTDENPDVRGLGADLAAGCVAEGPVDADAVVADLRTALSGDTDLRKRRVVGVFPSIARRDPEAVRPVLSTLERFLDDPLTATDAAAVFETVGEADPPAVADAVPTLVDCLFSDSISVRSAAADALGAIGAARPALLDDQLPVLLTVLDRDHAGVDAVAEVLATVADRPLDDGRTVSGRIRTESTAESAAVRRTATIALGTVLEADPGTDAAVTALTDRLDDADERVREAALDALATHVADTSAGSLVRSCYRTDTDRWRAVSAELLARATLFDGAWPSEAFQRWLADRLREETGATARSFVTAAGYVCGQTEATAELVSALVARLDDDALAATAFAAVRDVGTQGATTVPSADLAPAVERTVLDPNRPVPSACLTLVSHVAAEFDAPQRVADRLLDRLTDGYDDAGQTAAALAALGADDATLPPTALVSALERHAVDGPISARDWTCTHLGRAIREADGGEALRETFVPMAREGTPERRAAAYSALASVADGWPAGVEPAADTLRGGVREEDERISGPALSALVSVARASPAVLRPVTARFLSRGASSERVVARRRRHEALALLAADEASLDLTVARELRAGLLDGDRAVRESALEAAAALDDPRLLPVLERLERGVPDWESTPDHCHDPDARTDPPFGDLLPSDERTITAGDVLDRLGR